MAAELNFLSPQLIGEAGEADQGLSSKVWQGYKCLADALSCSLEPAARTAGDRVIFFCREKPEESVWDFEDTGREGFPTGWG